MASSETSQPVQTSADDWPGQVRHPLFARFYARASSGMERRGMADHRQRLVAGLAGRVLEVGAGTGLNFSHYPAGVTSVLAVEPEPYLRTVATQAAQQAPVPVEVVRGTAARLPAETGTFDAVVASQVLCTVPDQHAALTEVMRVLLPGGQLRFLEHVRADTALLRLAQQALDGTIWPLLTGGCHTGRDTTAAIAAAGLSIDYLERFRFPDAGIPFPTAQHVLGIATRTGGPT
jgi:ubiquinone/menaquinone biosynthesis C-methylase UbiE